MFCLSFPPKPLQQVAPMTIKQKSCRENLYESVQLKLYVPEMHKEISVVTLQFKLETGLPP